MRGAQEAHWGRRASNLPDRGLCRKIGAAHPGGNFSQCAEWPGGVPTRAGRQCALVGPLLVAAAMPSRPVAMSHSFAVAAFYTKGRSALLACDELRCAVIVDTD